MSLDIKKSCSFHCYTALQ